MHLTSAPSLSQLHLEIKMLIEQAFMALPEFLTGQPFKKYKDEGTIVTAFSMAILQELNSRNGLNPVAALREEVNYPAAPNWRADLHLDLEALKIFTPELASYGYYKANWLEAKFCRLNDNGKITIPALKSTLLLLKDLVRLCTLPPDSIANERSESARYLLHAYQGEPKQYFTYSRNGGGGRSKRDWLDLLIAPGKHAIGSLDLEKENSDTFNSVMGVGSRYIRANCSITNLCHVPAVYGDGVYYIVLTRVDDFRVKVGNRWMARRNGIMMESHDGATYLLQASIARLLNE